MFSSLIIIIIFSLIISTSKNTFCSEIKLPLKMYFSLKTNDFLLIYTKNKKRYRRNWPYILNFSKSWERNEQVGFTNDVNNWHWKIHDIFRMFISLMIIEFNEDLMAMHLWSLLFNGTLYCNFIILWLVMVTLSSSRLLLRCISMQL